MHIIDIEVTKMCSCWNRISNGFVKYGFLVIWGNINIGVFYLTFTHYKNSPEYYYLHEMLGVGLCLARATASVINLNLGMLLLPMCRSLITLLRFIFSYKVPLKCITTLIDRCKGFHITCAWTLVIASGGHIFGHMMNAKHYSEFYDSRFPSINAANYPGEEPLFIIIKSVPGMTGLLLLAILSMIVSAAFYSIRTACYDLFWYTHRLYIIFYIMVLFHAIRGILKKQTNIDKHVPGCIYQLQHNNISTHHIQPMPFPESEPIPEGDLSCNTTPQFDTIGSWTWVWLSIPLSIYICDVLYRILCKQIHPVSLVRFQKCHQDMFEVQLKRNGFSCRPGQFILLQCPQISSFEWHPFTITNTYKDGFTLHIKTSGDWSERLQELLYNSTIEAINPVYIDGPFCSPMEDILKYKISICIAGGIGITPFVSILNNLRQTNEFRMLKRIYLIWIGRNIASFLYFGRILHNLHEQLWQSNKPDILNIRLFLTSIHDEEIELLDLEQHSFLQKRLCHGRPEWKSLLQNIIHNHSEHLGVFCCGPKSLTSSVARHCAALNSTTLVHFYHESF